MSANLIVGFQAKVCVCEQVTLEMFWNSLGNMLEMEVMVGGRDKL